MKDMRVKYQCNIYLIHECDVCKQAFTYLHTPWSRVLPEKLKRPELLKKFPAFYGTRRFITAFTRDLDVYSCDHKDVRRSLKN
jgi:hypothetical protein